MAGKLVLATSKKLQFLPTWPSAEVLFSVFIIWGLAFPRVTDPRESKAEAITSFDLRSHTPLFCNILLIF